MRDCRRWRVEGRGWRGVWDGSGGGGEPHTCRPIRLGDRVAFLPQGSNVALSSPKADTHCHPRHARPTLEPCHFPHTHTTPTSKFSAAIACGIDRGAIFRPIGAAPSISICLSIAADSISAACSICSPLPDPNRPQWLEELATPLTATCQNTDAAGEFFPPSQPFHPRMGLRWGS